MYDFTGRTDRELTFKKDDVLVVFNQASDDWWEGAYRGKEGLIPDKYVTLRQRYEWIILKKENVKSIVFHRYRTQVGLRNGL